MTRGPSRPSSPAPMGKPGAGGPPRPSTAAPMRGGPSRPSTAAPMGKPGPSAKLGGAQLGAGKMNVQSAKLGPQELGAAKMKSAGVGGPKELGAAKMGSFKRAANPERVNQTLKEMGAGVSGPKGPTMGAGKTPKQTVKLGAQELGAAKLKPQSVSLGAKQLGAAKMPQFKQAGPSNPMGRMGGKPGVNVGTGRK